MRKVKTHECVSGFEACEEYRHVSLCTRVGLNISILGIVELANALDSEILNLINNLATTIIASSGIALGVLVGAYRTHSSHNLVANEVLRSDKLDALCLT